VQKKAVVVVLFGLKKKEILLTCVFGVHGGHRGAGVASSPQITVVQRSISALGQHHPISSSLIMIVARPQFANKVLNHRSLCRKGALNNTHFHFSVQL